MSTDNVEDYNANNEVDKYIEEYSFDDITPSEAEEAKTGIIKTVNAELKLGYPLALIKIHEADNLPLRKLESIKHMLDTTTNEEAVLDAEKRLRVAVQFTKNDSSSTIGTIGTIRPNRIMQLMSILSTLEVEGYLSKGQRVERKYLYALSTND